MPDREHKLRGSDPRFQEPRSRGDSRVLDLKSGRWQWKIGGDKAVIYSPDNDRHDVPLWTLFDLSKAEWDHHHDQWPEMEESNTIPVTPRDVSDYINEKILGRCLVKGGSRRATG